MSFKDLMAKIQKWAFQPTFTKKDAQSWVRPEQDISEEEDEGTMPSQLEMEERRLRRKKKRRSKPTFNPQDYRPFSQEELVNIEQGKQGLSPIQSRFIDQLVGQFNEQIEMGQVMTILAYKQVLDQLKQYRGETGLVTIPTTAPTISEPITSPIQTPKVEPEITYTRLPESKLDFRREDDEAAFEQIKEPQRPPKSVFENVFSKGPQADAFMEQFGKNKIIEHPFFKSVAINAYNMASKYSYIGNKFLSDDEKVQAAAGEIYTNIELALGRVDRRYPEDVMGLPQHKDKPQTRTLKDYRFVTLARAILDDTTLINRLSPEVQTGITSIFGGTFDKKNVKIDNIAAQMRNSPYADDLIILLNQLINEGNETLFKSALSQASWLASRQFQKGDMGFMGGEAISTQALEGRDMERPVDISTTQGLHPQELEGESRAEKFEQFQGEFDEMILDLKGMTDEIMDKILSRIMQNPNDKNTLQWERMKVQWFLANKQLEDARKKIQGEPSSFKVISDHRIANECGSLSVRDDRDNPYKMRGLVSANCLGRNIKELGQLKLKMKDLLTKMSPEQTKQQLTYEYLAQGYNEDDLIINMVNDDSFAKTTSIQSGEYINNMYNPMDATGVPIKDEDLGNRWISVYQSGIIPYFSDILITFSQKQKEIMQIPDITQRREAQRQFDIARKNFFAITGVYSQVIPKEEVVPEGGVVIPVAPPTFTVVDGKKVRVGPRPSRGKETNNALRAMGFPYTNEQIYSMLIGDKDLPLQILEPKPRMAEAAFWRKETLFNRLIRLEKFAQLILN